MMEGESLLNLLQQNLLSHPDYSQLAHKLKSDVQSHPTRDEQKTILSALSKYDKENKLITSVQQSLISLGQPNIADAACEVLVSLIQKDKGTVFVLHQFLNQPLPPQLRRSLYLVLLGDEAVGGAYLDAVRDKPYATFSPQEGVIRDRVGGFIQGLAGFSRSQFLHTAQGQSLMVKSLSYWHIHVGRPLSDLDYRLLVPIISLQWPDDSISSVNEVVSLLSGLSQLLVSLKATDPTTLNIVLQYVQLAEAELSEHIMLLRPDLSTSHHSSPTAQLVATLHEKLFVGFLSEEVIKYLLDQCVIGQDVSSYNPLFSFTATILCLCSSSLSQCNNVSSALTYMEQQGTSISTRQVQQFIQLHYIDSLATQLSTKPSRVHFHTKPSTLGEPGAVEPGNDTRRLLKEVEDLKKKLGEQKKQRNENIVAHRNEMAVLRAENDDLKKRLKAAKADVPATPPVVPVVAALQMAAPPPPDSEIPRDPEPDPQDEPEEEDGDISGPLTAPLTQRQVQNLWLEIAKNVMQRVKRLAFKNPQRKQELDTVTFYLNKQYEEDRAKAELQLYGAEIPPEVWDEMGEEEYYEKICQIDGVVEGLVRRRIEEEAHAPGEKKKKK